jgi:hypothetical protein
MAVIKPIFFAVVVIAAFGAISWWRDTGYAGPHHDEVIALLASKGQERQFAKLMENGDAPFDQIVPALEWQKFTHGYRPLPFAEIREDVQLGDLHPPLAFWLFNRWLSLFGDGGYPQAVMLTWFQVIVAACLLGLAVLRLTESSRCSRFAFALFLLGNSAVFSAVWVRQYALLTVWYAAMVVLILELLRPGVGWKSFCGLAAALGAVSACGMMTQYTFATMSFPVHAGLVAVLIGRKAWMRLAVVALAYAGACAAFFVINTGAIRQVLAVSSGFQKSLRFGDALQGIPQMIVPWPSFLPARMTWMAGAVMLAGILGMGLHLSLSQFRSSCQAAAGKTSVALAGEQRLRVPLAVILSGILGAGLIQFLMVGLGYYPGWATGPNHLCPLWLLSVLTVALFVRRHPRQWLRWGLPLGVGTMMAAQVLFGWHCHRIKPRTSPQYTLSLKPDLACLDNLARGHVLELTEVMPPGQTVLVARTEKLLTRLQRGELRAFDRILYLPVDENHFPREVRVVKAFADAGWRVEQEPVVHPGLYDAWLFTARRDKEQSGMLAGHRADP